jgi:hypothetical protein
MSRFWVGVWVAWFAASLVSFVVQRFVPRWLFATVLGGFSFWFFDHILA